MHLTLTSPVQSGGRFFTRSNVRGYCFAFNGQMKDDELHGEGNTYAFEYRIHDARLGRFLSVDPLFRSYPYNSSYAFAENDVIRCLDLEGTEKKRYTLKQIESNGKTVLSIEYEKEDNNPLIPDFFESDEYVIVDQLGGDNEQGLMSFSFNSANEITDFLQGKTLAEVRALNQEIVDGELKALALGFALWTLSDELNQMGNSPNPFPIFNIKIKPRNNEKKEYDDLYRVQGGGSKVRFKMDANGKLTIDGDDMLFVTFNDKTRAMQFLVKRGDNAVLFEVKIDSKFVNKVRNDAVRQTDGRRFPGRPQQVDQTKTSDSYGIPKEYFQELLNSIKK